MPSTLTILSLLSFLLLRHASAHTWNEQFALIGSDGKYTGPLGYSRGYVSRTDPGYNGYSMLHLLPSLESGRTRIDSSDLLCHPAQRHPVQSPNYPRLQVAPGSSVALKYLENGHVTLPENQPGKPPMAGTAFVFGTTSPKTDEKIATVLQWTKDGSGGDGRGRQLAANNFDDGRCHQINSGPISMERQQWDPDPYPDQPTSVTEQWCETDLNLPSNLTVGKPLTIYWVWQWPTSPGAPGLPDGKDEYYTTCSDFDVVAKEPDGPITNTLSIQDPQTLAVSDYKSRPAITPVPNLEYDPIGPGHKLSFTPTAPATSLIPPFSSSPSIGVNLASAAASYPTTLATLPATTTLAVPAVSTPISVAPTYPAYTSSVAAIYTSTPLVASSVPIPAPSVDIPGASVPLPASSVPVPTPSVALPVTPVPPPPPASSVPIAASSVGLPITSVPSAAPVAGAQTPVVLTALVTVTATLAPSQSMLIVQGSHVVTFSNPQMTLAPRAEFFGRSYGHANVHRRRAVVHARL